MSELGLWIGPIAPQEFLQSFIPQSDLLPKEISNIVDFSSFASLEEEGEMYGAMINAVMDHGLMPKITELANSLPERNEQDYQRDVSWLFDAPMPENVRRYIMALQENIVVCKPQRAYDPFKEVEVQPDNNSDYFSLYQEIRYPESRIIPDTEKAFGTQIHLLNHASSLFAHQHRLFCFNILICGDTARFIRWDRGGAVVSSSFDYAKHPLILAEFFWRYDGLTAAQRGYDPTARPAEESEALRLREAVKKHENGSKRRIPDMREKTLKKSFTPFVITMNGQTPSGKRKIGKYVVQAPMHTPFTPVGRSTQVYYALDLRTDELVCLKDYWRPAEATRPPESVVYARLRKHRIPHLPTMLLSGDVGPAQLTEKTKFQQTYTAIWVRAYIRRHPACIAECGKKLVEKDVEPDKDPLETPSVLYLSTRPSTFSHYRIVQKLLYSLSTAESSKVLVRAIRNSIICLTTAYEKANVLHRDVSSGNVMLDEDGQGVLNDWDHALMFERTDEAEVPLSGRTGTWYFLSVDLARHPYKNHDILDDLESCFWVLLWQAIHHLKSSADYTDLEIFKEQNNFGKTVAMLKGGSWKLDHIIDRSALHSLEFKCKPLNTLYTQLRGHFRTYYRAQERQDMVEDGEAKFNAMRSRLLASFGTEMIQLIDQALADEEWPSNPDALPDRFPERPDSKSPRESFWRTAQSVRTTTANTRQTAAGDVRSEVSLRKRVRCARANNDGLREEDGEDEEAHTPKRRKLSLASKAPTEVRFQKPPRTSPSLQPTTRPHTRSQSAAIATPTRRSQRLLQPRPTAGIRASSRIAAVRSGVTVTNSLGKGRGTTGRKRR